MTSERKARPKSTTSYTGRILSWEADLSFSAMRRGRGSSSGVERFDTRNLIVTAELLEAIDGRTRINLKAMNIPSGWVQLPGAAPSASVATISAIKEAEIEMIAVFGDEELAALLLLAYSNRLKSLTFSCGKPRNGRAEVSSLRLSTTQAKGVE